MINLRYHIVSLVAVFFALVIGVVAGTTVVDQQLVKVLEGQTNSLRDARDRLEADKKALEQEVALWERFGETFMPSLVRGRLTGHSVVVIAQQPADGGTIDRLGDVLRSAGAVAAGRITFTARWALADQPTREQLALALGGETGDTRSLLGDAAARLAARLAAGGDPSDEADLVRALVRTGFLELDGVPGGSFPQRDTMILVLVADDAKAQPSAEGFLVPFLQALQDGFPLTVAQSLRAEGPVVERIRGDRVLAGAVSTVDDLDTLLGELSVVFAMTAEVEGLAAVHYGVRDGATSVAPDLGR